APTHSCRTSLAWLAGLPIDHPPPCRYSSVGNGGGPGGAMTTARTAALSCTPASIPPTPGAVAVINGSMLWSCTRISAIDCARGSARSMSKRTVSSGRGMAHNREQRRGGSSAAVGGNGLFTAHSTQRGLPPATEPVISSPTRTRTRFDYEYVCEYVYGDTPRLLGTQARPVARLRPAVLRVLRVFCVEKGRCHRHA